MSADNTIVILVTKDIYRNEFGSCVFLNKRTITAYRVAEITNAEYLLDGDDNDLLNLGARLNRDFGRASVWYDRDNAWKHARNLAEVYRRQNRVVEYGIQEYELPYSFPF